MIIRTILSVCLVDHERHGLITLLQELIEEAKKEWELGCLQVMTTEAERQAEMEEDDIFFTYDRADATNKVHNKRLSRSKDNLSKSGGQRNRSARSRSNGRNRRQTPSTEKRYSTRSGASSPVEAPGSGGVQQGAGRKSPRIRSPNHVMVNESKEQQNHVNTLPGRRSGASSPLGLSVSVGESSSSLQGEGTITTRTRSRSSSSTNSSSHSLASPSGQPSGGPLSPSSSKPWIITTRAQKRQKSQEDGGGGGSQEVVLSKSFGGGSRGAADLVGQPLSPGRSISSDSGIQTRFKAAVLRQNDVNHSS